MQFVLTGQLVGPLLLLVHFFDIHMCVISVCVFETVETAKLCGQALYAMIVMLTKWHVFCSPASGQSMPHKLVRFLDHVLLFIYSPIHLIGIQLIGIQGCCNQCSN